jgi:hypothetical protein
MLYGIFRPDVKYATQSLANRVSPYARQPLAQLVRALHTSAAAYGLILSATGTEKTSAMAVVLGCLAIVAFHLNGGCFIGDFESALDGKDYCIIDPLIELLRLPVTTQCRCDITAGFMFVYLATVLVIHVLRFGCP